MNQLPYITRVRVVRMSGLEHSRLDSVARKEFEHGEECGKTKTAIKAAQESQSGGSSSAINAPATAT